LKQPHLSLKSSTIRVLHVDDEETQLKYAKALLEMADESIHVESVISPEDALRLLKTEAYDCVVSDFQMPSLDGIEFARRIREFSDIPIIIYTGRGSEEVAEAAFTVGVNDYMRKETHPSHYQVLTRRIRAAVEKHRTENALKKSEGKYRSLVQNSRDGVLVFTGSELVYANQQAAALHGCSSVEELMKVGPSNLLHPEDREWIEERSLARQRGEDVPPISEFRLALPDGTVRTVQSSSSVIEYSGKTSTLAFLRDITERKRIETELQDSEERWRSLVELAPDGIMTVDLKGFITMINDAFVKLTGFSREEIVGKHFTRLGTLRARDIPIYVKLFASLVKGDIPPSYEFIFKRKDGSERWAEMQLRLIETAEKKRELLAVVSDVSERKRMEEELKQYSEHLEELVQEKTTELSVSEERLRSFMASAPDAFTLYDSELNCLDVNEALLKYWPEGTRKEDLIGKNILDMNPHIKETDRYDRYLEVIKTGKPFQMEDSTLHPVFGSARLSLKAFKVGEGLGIITTDITDVIRMEEELIEAERMSAIGRVSAMVGHDLRGPLQTIKNALYLMERTPEKAGELRGTIGDSVDYAARILDDLRYSTRDVPVHLQESSVGAILQKTVASSSVPDRIEVDLDVGEGLESVRLDPLMMQRVLDNLVRNSVEAMADGGVLSLTAFKEPDWVIIKVSDTGIGIPEEDLTNIFTLFFTSKPGGMGLGLAYCKRAVEAHGGTIKVESEVDRGTTFTVRIPMKHE